MTNISEFERTKPKGTHGKINGAINKYETMISKTDIMDDEDAAKIEMSNDFIKELRSIRESFLKGE